MTDPLSTDPAAATPVARVAAEDDASAPIAHAETPFRRIMGAMIAAYIGGIVTISVPVSVLLTIRLIDMVGEDQVVFALGIITGAGAVAGLIVNPISGRVSDRTRWKFGRRRTWILAGGLAGACAMTAITLTTEVWQIVLLWCLVEIFIGFQMGATGALMADQVPADRRGAISGAMGFIVALGPVIGLALIAPFSGAAQWLIVGVIGVAGCVVAVLLLRERVPDHTPAPLDLKSLLTSFWIDPRRHPAFAWAWLVRFFVGAVGAAGVYNGVYLLQRHGIAKEDLDTTVLTLSAVFVIIGGIACVAAGVISDRIRRQKPFVLVAGILGAIGLSIQAFAPSMPVVFVASAVSGIGAGIFLSVDIALSSRMLPNADDIGKDWGVMMLAGSIPPAIVPFFAPFLLGLGGFPLLYLVLAGLGVLGGLLVLKLPEIGREGEPQWAQLTVTR